jgi:hypothetical protein
LKLIANFRLWHKSATGAVIRSYLQTQCCQCFNFADIKAGKGGQNHYSPLSGERLRALNALRPEEPSAAIFASEHGDAFHFRWLGQDGEMRLPPVFARFESKLGSGAPFRR